MTKTFRYPFNALLPDFARAAAGFAVAALPLPWLTESWPAFLILSGLAIAFATFAASTLLRHRTTVNVGDAGISTAGPRRATVAWDRISAVDLRYFSTRRDREKGWMQLRVTGAGRRVRVDSALDGFAEVTARVTAEAGRRGIPMSAATIVNLRAMGIEPPWQDDRL